MGAGCAALVESRAAQACSRQRAPQRHSRLGAGLALQEAALVVAAAVVEGRERLRGSRGAAPRA